MNPKKIEMKLLIYAIFSSNVGIFLIFRPILLSFQGYD